MKKFKSIETKYMEERQSLFSSLKNLDRRCFMKVTAAAMGRFWQRPINALFLSP
jgi:hypothetical protein